MIIHIVNYSGRVNNYETAAQWTLPVPIHILHILPLPREWTDAVCLGIVDVSMEDSGATRSSKEPVVRAFQLKALFNISPKVATLHSEGSSTSDP
jgi:hypothetical protein